MINEFELFQLALDIDDPAPSKMLVASACEQNGEILSQVETLLTSHDGQSQFLNSPEVEQIADIANVDPDATALHSSRSVHIMTKLEDGDDEIPLG